jgi:hypothetical protein
VLELPVSPGIDLEVEYRSDNVSEVARHAEVVASQYRREALGELEESLGAIVVDAIDRLRVAITRVACVTEESQGRARARLADDSGHGRQQRVISIPRYVLRTERA